MKALIIGNGGREAALAWKIAQSPLIDEVWVTPHHPAACLMNSKIRSSEHGLMDLVRLKKFQLAVVGPELPLSEGVADQLRAQGIPTVGPGRMAARLETSKAFAKDVMNHAGIPTARSESFSTPAEALAFIELAPYQGLVVKADGPAAGKGVVVCSDRAHAARVVDGFFDGSYLGQKIERVVLEEKMAGPELSVFALCTGEQFTFLGSARDHKRLLDGDLGPNTGGMGTVAPVSDFTAVERAFVEERVFRPVLREMGQQGTPFQGFLFAGLMRTAEGLKVLEFNVRLGDPETQVLLPLMKTDLVPWLVGCAQGQLPAGEIEFSPETWVHTVLAAPGYPGTEGAKVRLGDEVSWPCATDEMSLPVPAGLTEKNQRWVSRGGRILGVSSRGASVSEARARSLAIIQRLAFNGAQWRRDIGGLQ